MTYPSSYYVFAAGALSSLALNVAAAAYLGAPPKMAWMLFASVFLLMVAAFGLFRFGEYVRDLANFLIRSDGQLDELVNDPFFLEVFPVAKRNRMMIGTAAALFAGLLGIGLLPLRSEAFLRPKHTRKTCDVARSTTSVPAGGAKASAVPRC